jgi:hypothetical protein
MRSLFLVSLFVLGSSFSLHAENRGLKQAIKYGDVVGVQNWLAAIAAHGSQEDLAGTVSYALGNAPIDSQFQIVSLLLANRASPNDPGAESLPLLQVAGLSRSSGLDWDSARLGRHIEKMLGLLLSHGANPNVEFSVDEQNIDVFTFYATALSVPSDHWDTVDRHLYLKRMISALRLLRRYGAGSRDGFDKIREGIEKIERIIDSLREDEEMAANFQVLLQQLRALDDDQDVDAISDFGQQNNLLRFYLPEDPAQHHHNSLNVINAFLHGEPETSVVPYRPQPINWERILNDAIGFEDRFWTIVAMRNGAVHQISPQEEIPVLERLAFNVRNHGLDEGIGWLLGAREVFWESWMSVYHTVQSMFEVRDVIYQYLPRPLENPVMDYVYVEHFDTPTLFPEAPRPTLLPRPRPFSWARSVRSFIRTMFDGISGMSG